MRVISIGILASAALACAAPNPEYHSAVGAAADGGGADLVPKPAEAMRYDFEADEQGWHDLRATLGGVQRSTARAYHGAGALAIDLDLAPGKDRIVGVNDRMLTGSMALPAGASVTYHVFVPSGHKLTYLQPYVLRFVKGQSMATWVGDTVFAASIATDLWATYTVTVPADSDRAAEVGIEFRSDPGWKGTVWVDAVTW